MPAMSAFKTSSLTSYLLTLAFLHLPLQSFAASKVLYFNALDCQQIHLISVYDVLTPSSQDTGCHSAPAGTLAVWVDSLDASCTGTSADHSQ